MLDAILTIAKFTGILILGVLAIGLVRAAAEWLEKKINGRT